MFKKTVVLSVVVALMLLGLFVDPSAAQNKVTDVSKRGSLLIFPKINTTAGIDTIIMLGNDAAKAVTVKCYWMDSYQVAWDFELDLTPYQPVWFSAKTGVGTLGINEFGPDSIGELKCWAVKYTANDGDLELLFQHNYLYGNALIVDTTVLRAFEYNAWAFNLYTQPTDLESGNLDLDGKEYDKCPAYLVYNFFAREDPALAPDADGAYFGDTVLSLSPCQQDLRQDRLPVCTKAKFDVWNENEGKLTGAYACVKCYFEGVLRTITTATWPECEARKLTPPQKCKAIGAKGENFTEKALKTDLGRFRVSPDTFTACKGVFNQVTLDGKALEDVCYIDAGTVDPAKQRIYKTPFVGVRLTDVGVTNLAAVDSWAGSTGTAAGTFTKDGTYDPYIKWDRGVTQWAPLR